MFEHRNKKIATPKRVVILGARGFVGNTLLQRLLKNNIATLALGREELDLGKTSAKVKLAGLLKAEDALIIAAANAPCKDYTQMLSNIKMMQNICSALEQQPVAHVIYISSDAVYADSFTKITEESLAAPTSLHGIMHLAREKMLESVLATTPLAILRPTLLYGLHDPHNGYGPNRFYRQSQANQQIALFGQGEEQRDHCYIEDVAEIIHECLLKRSQGILNIATGEAISFYKVAQIVLQVLNLTTEIKCNPRSMPMPHNGYRAFDISSLRKFFPNIKPKSLEQGLALMTTSKVPS